MVIEAKSNTRDKRKPMRFTLDQRLSILNSAATCIFYMTIVYQEHHKQVRSAMKKLSKPAAKAVDKKLDRQKKKMTIAWCALEESVGGLK